MKASVPEWSKGVGLSPTIERCVGSNPTGCIFLEKKNRRKKEGNKGYSRQYSSKSKREK